MTLSAIAATGAVRRPSGETRQEHEQRIVRGITAQLADPALATGGTWELMWLALTPDNGNLAYIAWDSARPDTFAVAVRGTVASNPIDLLEDFQVGRTELFDSGGSPRWVEVSKGAKDAFDLIVKQPGTQPGGTSPGVTLAQMLDDLTGPKASSTVHVTGHSLGGCVATMVGPYLQRLKWQRKPRFSLVTFAAPTAGLRDFADAVESLPWGLQERHVNAYDLIPLAWADITAAESWYPAPGPAASTEDKAILEAISKSTNGHVYVQPGAPLVVNSGYSTFDPQKVKDFTGQVAFQHANPTYLSLLGAPLTLPGPTVESLAPASGPAGTTVVISGSGFTGDSGVDFGRVAAPPSDVVVESSNRISVTAPPGSGDAQVRVTNMIGTSPAVPGSVFSYG
jgi:hypothetical protein